LADELSSDVALEDVEAPHRNNRQEAQQRPQQQAQGGGFHRGPRLVLDPATGERLAGRETAGGNFLYRFHFELYGMDRLWGRWIVGIATLFMFVAIVTGVIVHRNIFKDFFTFRPAKGKRSWLDAHNGSSVLSLPFHIVITFSGLLLFGNMMIPTALQRVYQGDMSAYRRAATSPMTRAAPTPPAGEYAPLTDLAPLLAIAQKTWQERAAGSITITNPGDRNAIVEVRQHMMGGSLAAGRSLAQSLRFDGVSGQPLEAAASPPPPTAVQTISNVLIMLHRGFFASPIPRWLLFLAGVGGSLMVASGLVMWSVARGKAREKSEDRQKPGALFGHRLVEVFNVAGIAGLLVATGAYFWANRLIPADLAQRNEWEIRVFFIVWAVSLAHALARRHPTAWVEQLVGAGLLSASLPFLNAFTGGLSLFGSIYLDQWLLAGFDLCALVSGAALLYAARQVHLHAPQTALTRPAPVTVAALPTETDAIAPAGEESHAEEAGTSTAPVKASLPPFANPQAEENQ
jgi:uncharacterized iron-regulated membrane protein